MNNQERIVEIGKNLDESKESYEKCRDTDLASLKGLNGLMKIKNYQNELLLKIKETNNAIGEIEVLLKKEKDNLSSTDINNLENALITYGNRLWRLKVINIEAQNNRSSKVNRRSYLRDFFILIFSVVFAVVYGDWSTNQEIKKLDEKIKYYNNTSSENTNALIDEQIEEIKLNRSALERVEQKSDSILNKIK